MARESVPNNRKRKYQEDTCIHATWHVGSKHGRQIQSGTRSAEKAIVPLARDYHRDFTVRIWTEDYQRVTLD